MVVYHYSYDNKVGRKMVISNAFAMEHTRELTNISVITFRSVGRRASAWGCRNSIIMSDFQNHSPQTSLLLEILISSLLQLLGDVCFLNPQVVKDSLAEVRSPYSLTHSPHSFDHPIDSCPSTLYCRSILGWFFSQ